MRIKTFQADTMQDALAQARAELGEDAVVLNSKHVKAGGVLGLGALTRVELMAAVDDVADQPQTPKTESIPHPIAVNSKAAATAYGGTVSAQPAAIAESESEIRQIRSDLRNLSEVVKKLLTYQPQSTETNQPLLVRLGVDDDIARGELSDLIDIDNSVELASALAGKMQAFVAPPLHSGRQVIAIVGPTGVGKTTTLAKLAAKFAIEQGKKTALVTADTYRIGAVEQLRTYARIMGLPLEIALSPDEVSAGVEKHSDKDIVLIDTVGRSQRSDEHLAELAAFIMAGAPTQTYLCVAASQSRAVQAEVIEKFAVLSPNKIVVTKIDESLDRGSLVNLPFRSGLPLVCSTMGQNVPHDIEFADAGTIAGLVTEVVL